MMCHLTYLKSQIFDSMTPGNSPLSGKLMEIR